MGMKIIMCKGLPASGKTTYAKELVLQSSGQMKRLNKDDLRAMMDAGKWSKGNEKNVLRVRDELVIKFLKEGYDVIIDDCNLAPKHAIRLSQLATENGALFEEKDFTTVPIEECIKRDAKRAIPVGSAVIVGMYNQFLRPTPKKLEYTVGLPHVVIVDIDGTLALFNKVNPYDRDFSKDTLNIPVANLIIMTHQMGWSVVLFSGRKDTYQNDTIEWLKRHDVKFDELHMRPAEDTRSDTILKKEFYEQYIVGKYNPMFVVDDRKKVKRMWVDQGLFVLDVNQDDSEF